MSIVVVDRITELPIDPQIAPVDGDWIIETLESGSILKYEYHPVVQYVSPIRLITVRAFMNRLELTERVALRASEDAIVVDMQEDLKLASYVDLDDAGLAFGLAYLAKLTEAPYPVIDVAIIPVQQVSDMVLDGTQPEAYLGIL